MSQLSSAAFRLAQEAAAGEGDKVGRDQQARVMNGRLDELLPRIQAAMMQA